eukprot:5485412-Amphidinium_carterae.1
MNAKLTTPNNVQYLKRLTGVLEGQAAVPASIIAGAYHVWVITDHGTTLACGYNQCGQLGLGHTASQDVLTLQPGLPGRVRMDWAGLGLYHSWAVAQDGRLFSCGCNDAGQLGLGHVNDQVWMQAVPFLQAPGEELSKSCRILQLALGDHSTWALADNGVCY